MIYLLILPVLAAVKVFSQGRLSRSVCHSVGDSFRLNALIFAALVVIMSALFCREMPTAAIILPAIGIGVFSTAFQGFYLMAFRSGPIGLATVINNFGLILPIAFGFLAYGEEISLYKAIGMALLVAPLILIPKGGGGKVNKRWLIFTLLALLSSGTNNIILTACAHAKMSAYDSKMAVILGYAVAAVLSIIVSLFFPRKPEEPKFTVGWRGAGGVALTSLTLGLYNVLTTVALRQVDGVVFYPVTSVLSIVLILLSDIIFYRERPSKKQWIGVGIGLVCVVLMNI